MGYSALAWWRTRQDLHQNLILLSSRAPFGALQFPCQRRAVASMTPMTLWQKESSPANPGAPKMYHAPEFAYYSLPPTWAT